MALGVIACGAIIFDGDTAYCANHVSGTAGAVRVLAVDEDGKLGGGEAGRRAFEISSPHGTDGSATEYERPG